MCVEQENKVSNRKMFFHNPQAAVFTQKYVAHCDKIANFCPKIQFWWNLFQQWIWIFALKSKLLKLRFLNKKLDFATVCVAQHVAMLSQSQHEVQWKSLLYTTYVTLRTFIDAPSIGFKVSSLTNPFTPRWASPINCKSEFRLSSQNCGNSVLGGNLQQDNSKVTSIAPCQM